MFHRYVPETTLTMGNDGKGYRVPVTRVIAHPPGTHNHSPLVNTCTALELVTPMGSRWWGCIDAYINSELRMVAVLDNDLCQIRRAWDLVPESLRVNRS